DHHDDGTYRGGNDLGEPDIGNRQPDLQRRKDVAADERAEDARQQVGQQSLAADDPAGQPAGDSADDQEDDHVADGVVARYRAATVGLPFRNAHFSLSYARHSYRSAGAPDQAFALRRVNSATMPAMIRPKISDGTAPDSIAVQKPVIPVTFSPLSVTLAASGDTRLTTPITSPVSRPRPKITTNVQRAGVIPTPYLATMRAMMMTMIEPMTAVTRSLSQPSSGSWACARRSP